MDINELFKVIISYDNLLDLLHPSFLDLPLKLLCSLGPFQLPVQSLDPILQQFPVGLHPTVVEEGEGGRGQHQVHYHLSKTSLVVPIKYQGSNIVGKLELGILSESFVSRLLGQAMFPRIKRKEILRVTRMAGKQRILTWCIISSNIKSQE